MQLPKNVQKIITTLEAAGHEAFIVGGCVRDIIRGVTPKDWDIATSAVPSEAKALFPRSVDTGIKHGTITVLFGNEHYEVTTYRIDGEYLDNRRPQAVIFTTKIEEDLSRRDFTVNAIAYNPNRGFVDPFDGQGDIKCDIIKCVGDPKSRFGEDALRMLRAIRFAAVLGFKINESALSAIGALKENMRDISAERIREELCKLLNGAYPKAAKLLQTTGLMYYVLRNREYGGDLDKVITQLSSTENIRLALFFSWAQDCEEILRDLRFDNKTIKTVSQYVKFLPQEIPLCRYEIKKILRIMPPQNFEELLQLKEINSPSPIHKKLRAEAHDILQKNECYTLRDLAINGDDLAAAGHPKGKAMGEKLEALLNAVMRDPALNTKEQLLCL
ncbi:MAG: CCA tRNA nucleotidyltransferase [Defluviitaleaceae bacterium]|nr:CCA tRNA nucleotidyltransferase [Defluviitaleaceae bacterium]